MLSFEIQREALDFEFRKIWRAWETMKVMLDDRGYKLPLDDLHMSLEDFKIEFANIDGNVNYTKLCTAAQPTEAKNKKFPKSGPIWVEFALGEHLSSDDIEAFYDHTKGSNFKTAILVTRDALSPAVRKQLVKVSEYAKVELFLLKDLMTNITRHYLVPKHTLLCPEEKAALLRKLRVTETELPQIKKSDPVARYLGLELGDVVKITRKEEELSTVYYRLCIA